MLFLNKFNIFFTWFFEFAVPLIIGLIGLNMMRIDYSGNKTLDKLNKNINTNNFNAY